MNLLLNANLKLKEDLKMNEIKFEIKSEEEFNAEWHAKFINMPELACLSEDGGLGMWAHQFEINVTNKKGENQDFTIAFQPECRNDGMRNYSGREIVRATLNDYEADESEELLEFLEYDESVLDELEAIAQEYANAEFERLLEKTEDEEEEE